MKIAVIGYGHRMQEVIRNLGKTSPEKVEIVAVTDPQRDAVEQVMRRDGFWQDGCRFFDDADEMLDQVSCDGVMVGTRCHLHAQMGAKVLRHSLPLFLEKPIATTYEDAHQLWQAYEQGGKPPVVVSFPLRVTTLALQAKAILQSGQIGQIAHVQAINNVPYGPGYFQRWYRDEGETGGLFLQKATHDIDAVHALIGLKPVEVCAMTSKQIFRGGEPAGKRCTECEKRETCTESPESLRRHFHEERRDTWCCFAVDTGNEDSGSMIVRYENGLHCSYSQNFFARKKAATRMIRVLGYRGTLELDWYTNRVQVFFESESSGCMVPVTRTVFSNADVDTAVLELLKGPKEAGLLGCIPKGTGLISVKQQDGVVTINMSKQFKEIMDAADGGQAAVKALVLTCSQFPDVTEVKLQVEGQPFTLDQETFGRIDVVNTQEEALMTAAFLE